MPLVERVTAMKGKEKLRKKSSAPSRSNARKERGNISRDRESQKKSQRGGKSKQQGSWPLLAEKKLARCHQKKGDLEKRGQLKKDGLPLWKMPKGE